MAGVLVGDHLFIAQGAARSDAWRPSDPLTSLAAIGALSDRLILGTIVVNVSLLHPALVIRHFAQLAALYGGGRVLAGLGAGWNPEEQEALGQEMPAHRARLDRLEESLQLARQLFDHHLATVEGAQVVARDLPLAPIPQVPPRIMLGGGSDRLCELAGTYADHLDLNGSSRRSPVLRSAPLASDRARRAATTVEDLEGSVERCRGAAEAAGRSPGCVTYSVTIDTIEPCEAGEVAAKEGRYGEERALGKGADVAQCPYVLIGPPERMAALVTERQERLGLSAIILGDGPALDVMCSAVLPLIKAPPGAS